MKRKRWVKIKTEHPNTWYLLSSDGDWIKRTIHYRDARGVVRGKNAKHRKVKKCIDTFYPSKNLNKKANKIEVKFDAGVHKTQTKKLPNLVLQHFGDKEPPCYNAGLRYKDGDPTNCSINNLEWIPQKRDVYEYNMKAYRHYKQHIYKGKIRYFRVPDSHPLYIQYQEYLKNFETTNKLVRKFVKDKKIRCRQIRVGNRVVKEYRVKGEVKQRTRPYFELIDDDKRRIEQDIKWLQPSLCNRPNRYGYYHLRQNGDLMKEWLYILKKNKHTIQEVPEVRNYTNIKDGKIIRSFAFYKGDLYVRIEAEKEFKVEKGLKEVQGIKFE